MAAADQSRNDNDAIPLPASPEARSLGCTCPDPQPGQGTAENPEQISMECHLHGLLWLLKEGKGEVP